MWVSAYKPLSAWAFLATQDSAYSSVFVGCVIHIHAYMFSIMQYFTGYV